MFLSLFAPHFVRDCRLNANELASGCGYSMVLHPETQQVQIGKKTFSFDKVFPEESDQSSVYEAAVKPLGA